MSFLASRPMGDLLQGLTYGMVIGLVALSLVLIWRATHVLNFAQGSMAMFASYVGMTQMEHGLNLWIAAALTIVFGFVFSGLVERVLVRPLYHRSEINPVVVMVGLYTLLGAVASAIWTISPRPVNPPFSTVFFQHQAGALSQTIGLSPYNIFEIVVTFGVMVLVSALFNRTRLGLQLRAAALNPEVARLLGVRVNRLLTLGWAIAGGVGAVAGVILATSSLGLQPSMMDALFILGFIAAAVGGLESPGGAVLSGVGIGIAMQFLDDYWNSNFANMASVVLLVVVLFVRPQGLFSKTRERRV